MADIITVTSGTAGISNEATQPATGGLMGFSKSQQVFFIDVNAPADEAALKQLEDKGCIIVRVAGRPSDVVRQFFVY